MRTTWLGIGLMRGCEWYHPTYVQPMAAKCTVSFSSSAPWTSSRFNCCKPNILRKSVDARCVEELTQHTKLWALTLTSRGMGMKCVHRTKFFSSSYWPPVAKFPSISALVRGECKGVDDKGATEVPDDFVGAIAVGVIKNAGHHLEQTKADEGRATNERPGARAPSRRPPANTANAPSCQTRMVPS